MFYFILTKESWPKKIVSTKLLNSCFQQIIKINVSWTLNQNPTHKWTYAQWMMEECIIIFYKCVQILLFLNISRTYNACGQQHMRTLQAGLLGTLLVLGTRPLASRFVTIGALSQVWLVGVHLVSSWQWQHYARAWMVHRNIAKWPIHSLSMGAPFLPQLNPIFLFPKTRLNQTNQQSLMSLSLGFRSLRHRCK